MRGTVRRREQSWQIVYDLGKQPCQRCLDCGRRRWLSEGRLRACEDCNGPLDTKTERRQQFRGGFRTKREAQRALIDALGSVTDGSHVAPNGLTLSDYLTKEWLPSRKPTHVTAARRHRGQVAIGTWASYRIIMETYVIPRIGDLPLQELGPAELNRLYDELETSGAKGGKSLSPKTVLNVHRALHKALADALKRGRVARNAAGLVEAPSAPRAHTNIWTVEQLREFLGHVRDDRLYAAWLLFATTGMRRGEVAGLVWSDLDLEQARLRVSFTLGVVDGKATWKPRPKSRAGQRTMSLDPATVEALRVHREAQAADRDFVGAGWQSRQHDHRGAFRDDLVFAHPDGSLVHPERFSRWFRRHREAAGLPAIRLHDVRHTYASAGLAAATGWHDVKVISERLGHASVGITLDTYSHVLPSADEHTAHTLARVILGQ